MGCSRGVFDRFHGLVVGDASGTVLTAVPGLLCVSSTRTASRSAAFNHHPCNWKPTDCRFNLNDP